MNTVTDLILTLSKNNISIKLSDNNELVVNAPKGFWHDNPDLLSTMKKNKEEIKAQLISKITEKTVARVDRSQFNSLSYGQARMWFHQWAHENNASYNMPICFRLEGNIALTRLKKSIFTLIDQHESLRMGFKSILGEPTQFILEKTTAYDVLTEQSCSDEKSVKKIIEAFIRKPFLLDNPPLFRVLLLHLSDNISFLAFCFHHTISDGMSIPLFLNQLITGYENSITLNENNYDYCDYTNWHNQWLNSPLSDIQLQYWKDKLQHHSADIGDLKGDKQRPLSITFDVTTETFSLPDNITHCLKDFSTEQGCTLYSALLAVYARLCCEYNDQSFFMVGTPVSGRTKPQFDDVIGLFVNTIPLCIEYKKDESYQLFCKRLTKQLALDFSNQDFPFDKIVNSLGIKRDIARNPLFQTMFLLEYNNGIDFNFPEASLTPYPIDLGFGQFDLTMGVSVSSRKIDISIEYNNKIYSKEWIAFFKNNFLNLVETLLKKSDIPLRYFSVTSPSEMKKLLSFGKLNEKKLDRKKINIAELVNITAQLHSEKIAIKDSDSAYTYRALSLHSDNIAKALVKAGVQPGEIIAIKMQRSKELIAAMLGIWKANATYLPIDPKSPIKRTDFVLKDSHCRWMIVDNITDTFKLINTHILCFDDLSKVNHDNGIVHIDEKVNPAYVIYTSGTTGLPKGVVIDHAGLQNLIDSYKETYLLTPDDRCSQFATQAFDVFACEVWPALCIGASVYMIDEDTKLSPRDVISFFETNEITVCDIPTVIASEIWNESDSLHNMRLMKIGGEKITRYPPKHLTYSVVNSYGPTENTVESTYAFLNTNVHRQNQSSLPPIGKPFSGVQAAVLNQDNKMVPICAPGELVLFGDNLASGYLNNAALTQEKFIEWSFCDEGPTIRGYKTGDIVSWQHDGQLQFIGRKDKQIKVRNFRIEISEIEHALHQIKGISHAVATVSGERVEEKIIVAFVVINDNGLSISTIKFTLKDFLPDFMIPGKIIFVNEIPLTINGKVDYESLLSLVKEDFHYAGQNYIEPKTQLEITLSKIWSEVLKINLVGVHDDFFDLGGDSLSSIRICALAKIKGISLKPLHLHQYKTISEIMQHIELADKNDTSFEEEKTTSPLSPMQNWFVSQEFNRPEHYNQSLLFIAPDFFNNDIAKKLLKWLLMQHSILTMRLSIDNQNYIINRDSDIDDYFFDIVIHKNENLTETIQDAVNNAQSQFNLYHGPLFKIFYIHDANDEIKRICIVAHHLLIDIASWAILTDDIQYFLSNFHYENSKIPFLPKTTSYAKWIESVNQLSNIENLSVSYEKNDTEKNNLSFGSSKTYHISLDAHFSPSLKKHEFVLLLCARYVGYMLQKSDVLVENESHGRFESFFEGCDLTRTIGWFTAIYPVSIDVTNNFTAINSIISSRKMTDQDKMHFLLNKQYENIIFDFSFNFHGDIRKSLDDKNNKLLSAPEKVTGTISPMNHRSAVFDINAYMNEKGLQIEITAPIVLEYKMKNKDLIENKMKEIMKELQ